MMSAVTYSDLQPPTLKSQIAFHTWWSKSDPMDLAQLKIKDLSRTLYISQKSHSYILVKVNKVTHIVSSTLNPVSNITSQNLTK